jgi:secondary thiamine-phosphate synthase enzyme
MGSVKSETIIVKTSKRTDFVDITAKINNYLSKNCCKEGVVTVFVPHTTAAVTINENADIDVRTDMDEFLKKLVPNSSSFRHFEGNSDSHIKTTLVSPSVSIPVENGKMLLGTWQSVFFCEFDGPRTRKVIFKCLT